MFQVDFHFYYWRRTASVSFLPAAEVCAPDLITEPAEASPVNHAVLAGALPSANAKSGLLQ